MRLLESIGRAIFREAFRRIETEHERLLKETATTARKRGYTEALDDPFNIDIDSLLPGNANQRFFREIGAVGPTGDKDFTPLHRDKVRQNAIRAYHLRGQAENLIEIYLDFIVGEGFRLASKDDKDKELVDWLVEFWEEPENDLLNRHPGQIAAALVEGELFLPVITIDETDGKMTIGYIDPRFVRDVQQDSARRDVLALVENPKDKEHPFRFVVLNSLSRDVALIVADDGSATVTKPDGTSEEFNGAMFVYGNNRLAGARRGKSELTSVLDTVDLHDGVLWRTADRAQALAAVLLDVTVTNPSDEGEVDRVVRRMGLDKAPETLQTIAHSDKVAIDAIAPKLGVEQMSILEQRLRLNIVGPKGLPEAFTGAGEDTNRATLDAQNSVPARRLGRKQRAFISFYKTVVRFGIRMATEAGTLKDRKDRDFKIIAPELGSKDSSAQAAAIASIGTALVAMVSEKLIKPGFANAVFTQAVEEAGFEFDPALKGVDEEALAAATAARDNLLSMTSGDDDPTPADESQQEGAKTAFGAA